MNRQNQNLLKYQEGIIHTHWSRITKDKGSATELGSKWKNWTLGRRNLAASEAVQSGGDSRLNQTREA
jgi:hypothetical protein